MYTTKEYQFFVQRKLRCYRHDHAVYSNCYQASFNFCPLDIYNLILLVAFLGGNKGDDSQQAEAVNVMGPAGADRSRQWGIRSKDKDGRGIN